MKRLLIPLFSFITATSIFYSCSLLKSLDEVKKSGFICSNYGFIPVNKMPKNEVLEMIRNYYENQYQSINNANFRFNGNIPSTIAIKEDSRAVFFNLDTLKKLIYYTEKAAEGFSPSEKMNLGLNIYFASYPAHFAKQKFNYDYTNRHTLIFIPSIFNDETKMAKDFDLGNSLNGTNTSSPTYFSKTFLNAPTTTFLFVHGISSEPQNANNMMSQNDGTGVPPPPQKTNNALLDMTDY